MLTGPPSKVSGLLGVVPPPVRRAARRPSIAFLARRASGTLIGVALFGVFDSASRSSAASPTHDASERIATCRRLALPVSLGRNPILSPSASRILRRQHAPVACTIGDAEIPERNRAHRAHARRMTRSTAHRPGCSSTSPTTTRCAPTSHVRRRREALLSVLGHRHHLRALRVGLRWDGPAAVDDLLDQLATFFTTDMPIAALDGLL